MHQSLRLAAVLTNRRKVRKTKTEDIYFLLLIQLWVIGAGAYHSCHGVNTLDRAYTERERERQPFNLMI